MSATPRPWKPFWIRASIEGELQTGALIPKDIFDALLAVAKAAATQAKDDPPPGLNLEVFLAVRALDGAHPGWRDWTP